MEKININGSTIGKLTIYSDTGSISVDGVKIDPNNWGDSEYKRLYEQERQRAIVLEAALNQKFPIEDLVDDSFATEEQAKELEQLIEAVSQKYELSHIFCFARKSELSNHFSVFVDLSSGVNVDLHYFLLFITKGSERVEHEIQDYVNNHYKTFKITAISHSYENARNAIAQGNRFFIYAFKGISLYHDKETFLDIALPKLNPVNTLEKAEKRFHDHIRMASGFLHSASDCIRNQKFFENGVFSLHQAVEQACITLIKVHMGYRIDLHNIARLIALCGCFSSKPLQVFPANDNDSVRLFQILRDSYGNARYKEDFKIDENDAIMILEHVSAFVELAENLCLEWINNLRTKVGNRNNETQTED